MKTTIRSIKIEDAVNMTAFHNLLISEGIYTPRKALTDKTKEKKWLLKQIANVNDKRRVVLVAVVENNIVGLVKIFRNGGFANHIGTLTIQIIPEYRSLGIGTKLLKKALIASKKETKIELVRLYARKENKRAIGLYKKLGFRKYGYLPQGVKSGKKYYDSVLMYKKL